MVLYGENHRVAGGRGVGMVGGMEGWSEEGIVAGRREEGTVGGGGRDGGRGRDGWREGENQIIVPQCIELLI